MEEIFSLQSDKESDETINNRFNEIVQRLNYRYSIYKEMIERSNDQMQVVSSVLISSLQYLPG